MSLSWRGSAFVFLAMCATAACSSSSSSDSGNGSSDSGSPGDGGATGNDASTRDDAASGDGSTTPVDSTAECEQIDDAVCKKLFQCDPGDPGGKDTSEADCESQAATNCSSSPANCVLDPAKVTTCANDIASVACNDAGTSQPPSCDPTLLCENTGQPYCLGFGQDSSSGGCSVTLDGCSNGSTYTLSCSGTTCTCSTNGGAATPASSITECPDRKTAISACGWNIYSP